MLAIRRYKAHFRWKHYTQAVAEGTEQPAGTEACASVTSAFLQILATVHSMEASRIHKSRNILNILSTNTRRTKVVELSTGTHRVADELRRHSLTDGEGGHYSTNLDRNRYGSDNNYLFTVTRYNLECLGLCPCLVDIEIIDTRNGNESQLVTAGDTACSCESPERAELADASHFAGSNLRGGAPPSPHREMRRVASAGALHAAGGTMRRVGSAHAMRRNPSAGRLYEYGAGPAHSRGSGGSDLFDALLMAATGDHDVRSHGEPPVSSRQAAAGTNNKYRPSTGMARRGWAHGSHGDFQDSLQNAMEPHPGGLDDDELAARYGSGARGRRSFPRRNSVSMIVENPVLAQTGAGDSLLVGPYYGGGYVNGGGGDGIRGHSGEGGGDTDHGEEEGIAGGEAEGEGEGDEHASFRAGDGSGLLLRFHKQSSAVNLKRMGANGPPPWDARRLQEEARKLREEARQLEVVLEESRSAQKAAERAAEEAGAMARRAADIIAVLRDALSAAGISDPTAVEGADGIDGLHTSEQEIELLRAELAETKAALLAAKSAKSDKDKEKERSLRDGAAAWDVTAVAGGVGAKGTASFARNNIMPPPALTPAAAAAAAAAFHMPYAMGMLPMFGMPPLNPYGGMPQPPPASVAMNRPLGGSMQKVASMPAMHHHHHHHGVGGVMSPPADREAKRKADMIPETDGADGMEIAGHLEGGDSLPANKRQAQIGEGGDPVPLPIFVQPAGGVVAAKTEAGEGGTKGCEGTSIVVPAPVSPEAVMPLPSNTNINGEGIEGDNHAARVMVARQAPVVHT